MKERELLLLRGAPGVGKSATAAALRDVHHFVVVEVDDLRGESWHVPELGGLDEGGRHHVALAAAAVMALALRAHRRVVVVDTFNAGAVGVFQRALRGRATTRDVALVVEPTELARRLATRPDGPGVFRDVAVSTRLNAELKQAARRVDITGISTLEAAGLVVSLADASFCEANP